MTTSNSQPSAAASRTTVANGRMMDTGKGRFGTFAGVLTPNLLTILGLILFLRTGWVVGQAGLVGALIIILIANSITFLTGLSLSAIATSMHVRTGGNYYLISRSLGLEIGGAIGIPLYLSQAISVAFYIIGFTEALISVPSLAELNPRVISSAVAVLFGAIAYLGADFALRIQYVVLAALAAALVSFFSGGWGEWNQPVWTSSYDAGVNFWTVFAIFFPAVTGITVGASMSGDLKNPAKSIPTGTIGAIIITALIYIATAIWLALHATSDALKTNTLIMEEIAVWPVLILVGVWAATLSSALGSVVAAPRTLQALAFDDIAPRWMASTLGSPTEPRMAVLITSIIALVVIWMGDLDFVAPVISMFFLNTYGMTNLAAGIEKMVGNPSYRPQFNVPWQLSLLGALGCYGAMFLINPLATVVAIVVSYGIFFYLDARTIKSAWGDVRSGILLTIAREMLLRLEAQRWHVKNWRPHILVFTGQPHNREHMAEMADWLSHGQGIVTFYQLIIDAPGQSRGYSLRQRARKQITEYVQARGMKAFAEADLVDNFHSGALTVAQTHGVGELKPNTVLMGWSGTSEGQEMQTQLLHDLHGVGKSVLLYHYQAERAFGNYKRIDIWWGGIKDNGGLMLLLAHIIKQHKAWQHATIRILRVIRSEDGRQQTEEHMRQLLDEIRVLGEAVVIVEQDKTKPFNETLREWSKESDLTLLGTKVPQADEVVAYSRRLAGLLAHTGTTLLVRSAFQEDLLDTES